MATNSGDRRETEARSGGKILQKRRIAPKTTPYDRPTSPSLVAVNKSPNWLSSASRILASGAGKLLSTVYSPDFSSSSSSASDSYSSDDEVSSESGRDDINQEDERLNNKDRTSSEMVQSLSKENQAGTGKNKTKHVIERLLMRETFSREECDRLITIIESRVSPIPVLENNQNGRSTDIPPSCSSPVVEAKNWLDEKKLRSASKSELDHGTCSQNSAMLPYYTACEVGSPVDVARSYMRLRPRWASISPNSVEVHTPSPVTGGIFGEELLLSNNRNYLSSSKVKRDSFDNGSWSISKEIRRVRAKASEDLLGSLSSSKIDWSPFASEHPERPKFLTSDTVKMGMGDNPTSKETPQDGVPTPEILSSEQNQDIEATPSIQGNKDSVSKEENGLRNVSTTNGLPSSKPSLKIGLDTVANQNPSEGQQSSSDERINTSAHDGETCELLSEAFVEVPITIRTDTVSTGVVIVEAVNTETGNGKITTKRVTRSLVSKELTK